MRVQRTLRRIFGPDLALAEAVRERPTQHKKKRQVATQPDRPLDLRLILVNDPAFDLNDLTERAGRIYVLLRAATDGGDVSALRPFAGDRAYSVLVARAQSRFDGAAGPRPAVARVRPVYADRAYGNSDPDNAYDRVRFRVELGRAAPPAAPGTPAQAGPFEEILLARRVGAPTKDPELKEFCPQCGATLHVSGVTCASCGAPVDDAATIFGTWTVKEVRGEHE